MGNCTSAPQKEEHLTPAEKVHQEVEDVEVDLPDFGGEDSGEGDTEEVLELSDFDLSSLDIVNPSLQEFSGASAIEWLREVRIHLHLSTIPSSPRIQDSSPSVYCTPLPSPF